MNKEKIIHHLNNMHVSTDVMKFQGDQELPFYVDIHQRYHEFNTYSIYHQHLEDKPKTNDERAELVEHLVQEHKRLSPAPTTDLPAVKVWHDWLHVNSPCNHHHIEVHVDIEEDVAYEDQNANS